MNEKRYRYVGVKPFEATNRDIFFGRDEDIQALYNLILSEKLVVLFGKSGYGKSSLLNAGVLPLLQQGGEIERKAMVIEVRLGTFVEEQSHSPLKKTLDKIIEKLPNTEEESNGMFLESLYPKAIERTLWYHVKRRQSMVEGGRFVMVFDQFEEFFSYPPSEQEKFKRDLAELLYSDIPQYLRKRLPELAPEAKRYLAQPMNVKAVFSIRSDRISLMDTLSDILPAILHKRYELRPLTFLQAREAIEKPAGLLSPDFITPPFEFRESALQKILTELSAGRTKGIEAFHLQILCQFLENQIENRRVPDRDNNNLPDIDLEDLPDLGNLYENYYRRQLAHLEATLQHPAQMVLEEGLLTEDPQSGEGRRMSVDSQFLIRQFAVNDALLQALENTYLVRKEPNSVGGESLEISHDILVPPMLKMKKERKIKEALDKAETQEREARQQVAIERRRRQRSNLLSGIAVAGLIVAIWQYSNAEKAVIEARKATSEALTQRSVANGALQKVIEDRKEKIKNQIAADEKADFKDAAQANRLFLAEIDSLEKAHVDASFIISEIEKHLAEFEK